MPGPGMGRYLRGKGCCQRCRDIVILGPVSGYGEVSVLSAMTDSCRYFPIPSHLPGHGEISAPKGLLAAMQRYRHPRTYVLVWGSICTVGYDEFLQIFPHPQSSAQAWGNICAERVAAGGAEISSSWTCGEVSVLSDTMDSCRYFPIPVLRLGMGKYLCRRLSTNGADTSLSSDLCLGMGKYLYCRIRRILADISPSPVFCPGMGKCLRGKGCCQWCRDIVILGPVGKYLRRRLSTNGADTSLSQDLCLGMGKYLYCRL